MIIMETTSLFIGLFVGYFCGVFRLKLRKQLKRLIAWANSVKASEDAKKANARKAEGEKKA